MPVVPEATPVGAGSLGAAPGGGGPEAGEPQTVHGVPATWPCGQQVLHPAPGQYLDLVKALREEGFNLCVDLTAVDYLAHPGRHLPTGVRPERFELVVNLLSFEHRRRARLRVQVPAAEPVVPSLFRLYPGTEAMEREAFDMMGIRFDGHPDLTRILMPEDWEGHPLRKDYSVGRVPVQFKHPPETR
ncbi:MAG TPA: NADH-quinone oxidoreductase subunit C [Acidimicrobiales bacterium]|nr:NADH-quinone oxidoreductase subunit C [Acidimicrobiales bacterium]